MPGTSSMNLAITWVTSCPSLNLPLGMMPCGLMHDQVDMVAPPPQPSVPRNMTAQGGSAFIYGPFQVFRRLCTVLPYGISPDAENFDACYTILNTTQQTTDVFDNEWCTEHNLGQCVTHRA